MRPARLQAAIYKGTNTSWRVSSNLSDDGVRPTIATTWTTTPYFSKRSSNAYLMKLNRFKWISCSLTKLNREYLTTSRSTSVDVWKSRTMVTVRSSITPNMRRLKKHHIDFDISDWNIWLKTCIRTRDWIAK